MVAKFKIYQYTVNKWRWRFESSGNYKIIEDKGEGYESKSDCEKGIKMLKKELFNATIEEA